MCCMPMLRCGPRRQRSGAAAARSPLCGFTAFPAIYRSYCCRIEHIEDIALANQLLQAHEYWRLKQLSVDLVILNEHAASYVEDLQNALETSLRTRRSQPQLGAGIAEGSVFVLRTSRFGPDMRTMLSSAARIVFVGARGTLADQLDRRAEIADVPAGSRRTTTLDSPHASTAIARDLEFFNGIGGFASDGREYVATLYAGETTPAPWINVIANPQFGFQIAMDGGGYTWSINSREHQLTPWSNDPVTDRPGEVLYVRDEDTGELWGPTVAPVRDDDLTLRSTPRARLQPLPTSRPSDRARSADVRAAGRCRSKFRACASAIFPDVGGGCPSPRTSNGCSVLHAARPPHS